VSKTALLFSTASMVAGVSNICWVPLAVKYGRRVVYTFSFLVFGLCCIWSARATSYGSLMASRIIASWFSGSAECVAPMTIADIFFLHERGKMTAYVNFCPSSPNRRDVSILTNLILECTQPRSRRVPLWA
jgi:MFS family permease